MAFDLTFARMIEYDAGQAGITVPINLRLAKSSVSVEAKIDTDSRNCIFARRCGEQLGLNIEDGLPKRIRTATGSFQAFEHDVSLSVAGYDFEILACFAASDEFQTNILGRHGFLMRVRLGLVDYEGKLFLNAYGEDSK